jgi:homoserine kinase
MQTFSVRVPASTSNLGAGFDCFGLALQLYLTVTATVVPGADVPCEVRNTGEVSPAAPLPENEENLIFRAMRHVADHEELNLPPLLLQVHNAVPLGKGLGSSAAAIVAGIKLSSMVCGRELSEETILRYAHELEGHADNAAASYLGGWVVTCVKPDGNVVSLKRPWPAAIKVIVVTPEASLKTEETRVALPAEVKLTDAVHNLQRTALFVAALDAGVYELLWEAMQDRLHQARRETLAPGLAAALAISRQSGLLGVALSGSGPSVVALATERLIEIGEEVADEFRSQGMPAVVRVLEVDQQGTI